MNHEQCKLVSAILPTWRSVYLAWERHMRTIKPLAFEQPSQWGMLWGKGAFMSFLAEDKSYPARQTDEVWEAFNPLRVSVCVREFIRAALWGKLGVHARVFVLSGTRMRLVCGPEETLDHALRMCRMYMVVKYVMRGRLKRSARAVQLFGRLAVVETHTLWYFGHHCCLVVGFDALGIWHFWMFTLFHPFPLFCTHLLPISTTSTLFLG